MHACFLAALGHPTVFSAYPQYPSALGGDLARCAPPSRSECVKGPVRQHCSAFLTEPGATAQFPDFWVCCKDYHSAHVRALRIQAERKGS